MDDQLMTTAQAAAQLGVDKSTLNRWVRAGRITPELTVAFGDGWAYLWSPAAVAAYQRLMKRQQRRKRAA